VAAVKIRGGRTLAAGKTSDNPPKDSVGILVWDSTEQLEGWLNSPDGKSARAVGQKYAKYRNFAVAGVPQ
jgi:hypothetical protein